MTSEKLHGALTMQNYVCELWITILKAGVATCRYENKACLHNYTNLHSASEGSKYNSLAGIIADLLLSLLQLEKQVRRADVYFCLMSADTANRTSSTSRDSPSNSIS